MVVVIDSHNGVPVFRQLRDQIRFQIVSGMLKPGDELPPTRALSAELGLNPMTISKAYSYLEMDGLVEKRPGLCLVVNALDDDEIDTRRVMQFRHSAKPVAAIAKQLGLSRQKALEVFAETLDGVDGAGGARPSEEVG